MRQHHWLLSLVLLCVALPATAGSSGVAASLDLSNAGIGLGLVAEFTPVLNGRLGYRGGSFDADIEGEESLNYSTDFKLSNVFGLLDFYPLQGRRFHVTAGAVHNGSDVRVEATCRNPSDCEVGGLPVIGGGVTIGTLTGDVDFRSTAPYLSLGWGNPLADQTGWSFRLEAGAMFLGEPSVELTSSGSCQSNAACRAALEQEERRLEEDAEDYEIYPVVNLTLSYRF